MKDLTENSNKVLSELNESWLNGKYENGEINTSLSFVSVESEDYFAQGSEADQNIAEIHQIWINSELTQSEAFTAWINMNF